jgi:hypothetical protein
MIILLVFVMVIITVIALDIKNKFIQVYPDTFRKIIFEELEFRIADSEKIIISPCFPNMVLKKYEESLYNNNIEVIGNWETQTASVCRFYNDKNICFMTWEYEENTLPSMSDMIIFENNCNIYDREIIRELFLNNHMMKR